MTDADLPSRLHELHVALLRELLARGADRAWLAGKVQESVDLVHEAAELRPPDPRHQRQIALARRVLTWLEAAAQAGYTLSDARATVRERLGIAADRTWHRLLSACHDLAAVPLLTLEDLEEPNDKPRRDQTDADR
jgi:hypothetical protein